MNLPGVSDSEWNFLCSPIIYSDILCNCRAVSEAGIHFEKEILYMYTVQYRYLRQDTNETVIQLSQVGILFEKESSRGDIQYLRQDTKDTVIQLSQVGILFEKESSKGDIQYLRQDTNETVIQLSKVGILFSLLYPPGYLSGLNHWTEGWAKHSWIYSGF